MKHHTRHVAVTGSAGSSRRSWGTALALALAGASAVNAAAPDPPGAFLGWSSTRPLLLRLADDQPFRPCLANLGATQNGSRLRCARSPQLRTGVESIAEIAAAAARPTDRRSAAVRRLIGGNAAGALDELSRIAATQALSHDLAVARAVAGLEAQDWSLLLQALDFFAERAERGDELARFNLGVLAEVLGLWRLAEVEWQSYLHASPEPGWSEEVEQRRVAVARRLEAARVGADRATDDSAAGLVAFQGTPHQARLLLLGRTLPRYLDLRAEGRNSEAAEVARQWVELAARLAAPGGDRTLELLGDELAGGISDERAAALRSYVAGESATRRGDWEVAERNLRQTREGLESHHPLALWACAWLAVGLQSQGRYEELGPLLACLDGGEVVHFPAVRATTAWTRGMALARQGQYEGAYHQFVQTEDLFVGAHEVDRAAAAIGLQTDVLRVVGSPRAWGDRLRALPLLQDQNASAYLVNLLWDASTAARADGYPWAALCFDREGIAAARELPAPNALREALLHAAQTSQSLGRAEEAERRLAEARSIHARLTEAHEMGRAAAALDLTEARMRFADDPAKSAELAARARAAFDTVRQEIWQVEAAALEGRALVRSGAVDRGLEALVRAARLVEARRGDLPTLAFRADYLEAAQAVYDELLRVAIDRGATPAMEEIAVLERARNLDETKPGGSLPHAAAATLGAGEVVASYGVVGDEVVIWRLSAGGVQRVGRRPVAAIRTLSEAFRRALEDRADAQEIQRLGRALHQELIAPLGLESATERLVVIPDRFLQNVPFAALVDPADGRFLGSRVEIVVSPSIARYLGRATETIAPRQGDSIVLVADPVGIRDARFPPVPAARREVEAAGRFYEHARVLVGAAATPGAVRAALPGASIFHYAGHADVAVGLAVDPVLLLAGDGAQSRATPSSLLGAQATPQIVVLSACSTSTAADRRSRTYSGLARQFLHLGAATVIGTLWPIHDEAAADLFAALHQYLAAGGNVAAAVRQVQQQAIAQGRKQADWAALQVVM